jgi:hypothetical protein
MPMVKAEKQRFDRAGPYPKRSRSNCTEGTETPGLQKKKTDIDGLIPAPILTSTENIAGSWSEATPTNGQQPKSRTGRVCSADHARTLSKRTQAHSADHARTLAKVRQFILNRMRNNATNKAATDEVDKHADASLVLNFFAKVTDAKVLCANKQISCPQPKTTSGDGSGEVRHQPHCRTSPADSELAL